MAEIKELVETLTEGFTKVIPRQVLRQHPLLDWGNNGIGDRWARKMYNYTVVYQGGRTKTYSDNDEDTMDPQILANFLSTVNKADKGIIGVFPHKVKTIAPDQRPIRADIKKAITAPGRRCVNCGTTNELICDHKNDLYNDPRVLNAQTQTLDDFQPLCNHCNLQKRQIAKEEAEQQKLFSAKKMPQCQVWEFEFPWEKYAYDKKNPTTKKDTYWYDPVEFMRKIRIYDKYVCPLLKDIRKGNCSTP